MEPIKYLSELVQSYVWTQHAGNIRKAADTLKLDYNTVYRLHTEAAGGISFFVAYDVLKALRPDDFRKILADFFPKQIATILEFSNPDLDPMAQIIAKFQYIFGTDSAYKIFLRACTSEGVPLIFVKEEFGRHGHSVVEKMISLGIVQNIDDIIHSPFGRSDFDITEDIAKAIVIKNTSMVQASVPGTFIKSPYGGFNQEGIKRLYEILERAFEEIQATIKDPKYSGPSVFVCSILGGPVQGEKVEKQ